MTALLASPSCDVSATCSNFDWCHAVLLQRWAPCTLRYKLHCKPVDDDQHEDSLADLRRCCHCNHLQQTISTLSALTSTAASQTDVCSPINLPFSGMAEHTEEQNKSVEQRTCSCSAGQCSSHASSMGAYMLSAALGAYGGFSVWMLLTRCLQGSMTAQPKHSSHDFCCAASWKLHPASASFQLEPFELRCAKWDLPYGQQQALKRRIARDNIAHAALHPIGSQPRT